MSVTVNGGAPQRLTVQTEQPFVTDAMLQTGWNRIGFALETGNFSPSDVQPGNGDQRQLSFAVALLEFLTE
jgi:hypothetical protein